MTRKCKRNFRKQRNNRAHDLEERCFCVQKVNMDEFERITQTDPESCTMGGGYSFKEEMENCMKAYMQESVVENEILTMDRIEYFFASIGAASLLYTAYKFFTKAADYKPIAEEEV